VIHYFFPASETDREIVPGKDTSDQVVKELMELYETIARSRFGWGADTVTLSIPFRRLFQAAALCVEEGWARQGGR